MNMPENRKVWIVDDDKSIRWVLEKALSMDDIVVTGFSDPREVLEKIKQEKPDVIISDVRMPGLDGISLLEKIKQIAPSVPVIIMTAYSDLDRAVAAFREGAYEFLSKPFDVDEVVSLVTRAIHQSSSRGATVAPAELPAVDVDNIVGSAPAMQEVFRAVGRLSNSNLTVLITGESGTGKELVPPHR